MVPEQQRYWISLLNLQRSWVTDADAESFLPPRYRDFTRPPAWSRRKAFAYLLNNVDLIRESHRRLEAGELLDYDLLNHGLSSMRLRLQPWGSVAEAQAAGRVRAQRGGRLESLQVRGREEALNPGTAYIRATVERSLYYFAQYVDHRLADARYPDVSPAGWRVVAGAQGDLDLREPEQSVAGEASR